MRDIKKIMVAIGFSEYSQEILNFGAGLAKSLGAEMVVAHVINARDVEAVESIAAQGYNLDSQDYVRDLKAQNRETLSGLLKSTGFTDDEVKAVFKVGHPVDALLRIIVAENVDMVVMGTKGRSDIEHILMGSVAEKIFRRSPVPVVSYRDAKHAERLRQRID